MVRPSPLQLCISQRTAQCYLYCASFMHNSISLSVMSCKKLPFTLYLFMSLTDTYKIIPRQGNLYLYSHRKKICDFITSKNETIHILDSPFSYYSWKCIFSDIHVLLTMDYYINSKSWRRHYNVIQAITWTHETGI